MLPLPAGRDASAGAPRYTRHRPECTLLYQLVREYYPAFTARLAAPKRAVVGRRQAVNHTAHAANGFVHLQRCLRASQIGLCPTGWRR